MTMKKITATSVWTGAFDRIDLTDRLYVFVDGECYVDVPEPDATTGRRGQPHDGALAYMARQGYTVVDFIDPVPAAWTAAADAIRAVPSDEIRKSGDYRLPLPEYHPLAGA